MWPCTNLILDVAEFNLLHLIIVIMSIEGMCTKDEAS